MRSLLLARSRALIGCACAVLVAGCSTTAANTSTSVAGHTLSVYVSRPPGTLTSEQQDVLDAEQLALHQLGSSVSSFTVRTTSVSGGKLSDHARTAIADATTIAYLGELEPGTSAQTIGITNAQDILQVSPTDTALELTQSVPEVAGSPGIYYESLSSNGHTFGRVVPNDKLEAKALVGEIARLGVKQLYIKTDGSEYGAVLRGQIVGDAPSAGISIQPTPSGAAGVLFAGTSAAGATTTFDQAVSGNPAVKLFAPSALASRSFAAGLSPTAQHALYVSSPGFTTVDLSAKGKQFVSAFKVAYGHSPATQAIFGYAAMEAVLAALHTAGKSANDPGTVVKDFRALRNQSSVLGTYSINSDGDISFASGAPFVFSRFRGGNLVPFKAVQQQG